MAKTFVNNVNEKNLILTRAQGAVISRDFPTAARLYKQLLKDDPSNVDYLKELGSIYVKNGEDAKAIPYYEQIITFYPHYIDAMTSLGAIYRRLKRYEESIEILSPAPIISSCNCIFCENFSHFAKEVTIKPLPIS